MKVLITGGSGFIGKALIKKLHFEHTCIPIDRTHGVDFSSARWESQLPIDGVDVVYHLAQATNYQDFPKKSDEIFKINIESTAKLLEWSRLNNVKGFFLASTGNVYAPISSGKLAETNPTDGLGMYGASKLCAEQIAKQYKSFFNVVIGRLFMVYGPGQKKMLIQKMVERIKGQQTITLVDDKGLMINPIYIDDCVNALENLMFNKLSNALTTLNIGGPSCLSLKDIVIQIGNVLGSKPIFDIVDGTAPIFCSDIEKMKKILKNPLTPFAEGIRETLKDSDL